MNLRDLEYLTAVVEYRHFGKAAKAVFATQPTLSLQLKKLEAELEIKLLERTSRKVLITPLGEKIAERARAVLGGVREIRALAEQAKDPFSGELLLGVFPTLAPHLLPRIVPGILRAYPKLKLKLVEEKTEVLLERLRAGKIDAAFLALPVKKDGLEARFLFQEEFVLAVSKSHPWAARKKVTRAQLRDQDLLLLEEGHCLRDQALEYCSKSGAGEFADFRASSLETLQQMVAADVGMTLIPKMAVKKGGPIAYIPLEDPRPSRRIALIWRGSSVRRSLLEDLHARLAKTLPKLAS